MEKMGAISGVFEWHENQMLVAKFLRLGNGDTCLQYFGIFELHLTNGLFGGIGFYYAILFTDYVTILPLPLLGFFTVSFYGSLRSYQFIMP